MCMCTDQADRVCYNNIVGSRAHWSRRVLSLDLRKKKWKIQTQHDKIGIIISLPHDRYQADAPGGGDGVQAEVLQSDAGQHHAQQGRKAAHHVHGVTSGQPGHVQHEYGRHAAAGHGHQWRRHVDAKQTPGHGHGQQDGDCVRRGGRPPVVGPGQKRRRPYRWPAVHRVCVVGGGVVPFQRLQTGERRLCGRTAGAVVLVSSHFSRSFCGEQEEWIIIICINIKKTSRPRRVSFPTRGRLTTHSKFYVYRVILL